MRTSGSSYGGRGASGSEEIWRQNRLIAPSAIVTDCLYGVDFLPSVSSWRGSAVINRVVEVNPIILRVPMSKFRQACSQMRPALELAADRLKALQRSAAGVYKHVVWSV